MVTLREQNFYYYRQSIDTQSALIGTRAVQSVLFLPKLRRVSKLAPLQRSDHAWSSKNVTIFFTLASFLSFLFLLTTSSITFVGHTSFGQLRIATIRED